MSIGDVQDKQKEIAFFDAHAARDEYDVFTPEASARLISAFVRLSPAAPASPISAADRACLPTCCGAPAMPASASTSVRNWSHSAAANIPDWN
jgi:hypothetical protein